LCPNILLRTCMCSSFNARHELSHLHRTAGKILYFSFYCIINVWDFRLIIFFQTSEPFSHSIIHNSCYFLWSIVHLWKASFHFSFLILKTVGRSPWTEDQPIAWSLPAQGNTNTDYTSTNNHASSEIRNHDRSVRASDNSSGPLTSSKQCHVYGVSATNNMGFGVDDWVYWHFFTITINYDSSKLMIVCGSLPTYWTPTEYRMKNLSLLSGSPFSVWSLLTSNSRMHCIF
jgi:hypothetical protein